MAEIEVLEATGSILRENGVFFLSGEITEESSKEVIIWILESNLKKEKKLATYDHLTLIINSAGGDLGSAFAITDIMFGSKIPIHTVGIGEIISSSLVVFIAGVKGHRILTPNTSILSHQYMWGAYEKYHELISGRKEQDLVYKRLVDHYKKCTGLTPKEIKEELLPQSDVWLNAKEALNLHICDEVKIFKQ